MPSVPAASGVSPDKPNSRTDLAQFEEQIDRLKSKLRLAVIFGGSKSTPDAVIYPSRNSRSWKSYEAVSADIAASLQLTGFQNVELMPDDMTLGDRLRRAGTHMAWLNTSGVQGYNPAAHTAAMLEMLGVPYVGHDPLAATTLDNKHAFKREAICAGLPTAPFVTWQMTRGTFQPEVNTRFLRAFGDYPGPFVVKPVSGRASLHVHFVGDRAGLAAAIEEVYSATGNVVLIEKYLSGREFCIAVAGPVTARHGRLTHQAEPFTFAAMERVLAPNEKIFTSMDTRPITRDRCHSLNLRHDSKEFALMTRLARDVFLEFNLSSIARLDLRSDENGDLWILEANPKPDLKRPAEGVTSLIAEGLGQSGMDYDDLILSLLADRLGHLLTFRRETVGHILELLTAKSSITIGGQSGREGKRTAFAAYQAARMQAAAAEQDRSRVDVLSKAAAASGDHETVMHLTELATDAGLRSLDSVPTPLKRARRLRGANGVPKPISRPKLTTNR